MIAGFSILMGTYVERKMEQFLPSPKTKKNVINGLVLFEQRVNLLNVPLILMQLLWILASDSRFPHLKRNGHLPDLITKRIQPVNYSAPPRRFRCQSATTAGWWRSASLWTRQAISLRYTSHLAASSLPQSGKFLQQFHHYTLHYRNVLKGGPQVV